MACRIICCPYRRQLLVASTQALSGFLVFWTICGWFPSWITALLSFFILMSMSCTMVHWGVVFAAGFLAAMTAIFQFIFICHVHKLSVFCNLRSKYYRSSGYDSGYNNPGVCYTTDMCFPGWDNYYCTPYTTCSSGSYSSGYSSGGSYYYYYDCNARAIKAVGAVAGVGWIFVAVMAFSMLKLLKHPKDLTKSAWQKLEPKQIEMPDGANRTVEQSAKTTDNDIETNVDRPSATRPKEVLRNVFNWLTSPTKVEVEIDQTPESSKTINVTG